MSQQSDKHDPARGRARARTTAWIIGAIAIAIYVLFFIKQGILR